MSSDKISISNDKLVIHNGVIRQELSGKISEKDIQLSESIITDMRNKKNLRAKILTGSNCLNPSFACTELNNNDTRAVPYGNMDSPIVFVNKIPTVLECKDMLSHSDTAGYFLMMILSKLGYKPGQLYFTDFIKCCDNNINANDCLYCAANYFLREIELIKPKILVCEGLDLLNVLVQQKICSDIKDLKYGMIYDSYFMSENNPIKITAIYDLNQILQKEGNDLQQCKSILWAQLSSVVQSVKN